MSNHLLRFCFILSRTVIYTIPIPSIKKIKNGLNKKEVPLLHGVAELIVVCSFIKAVVVLFLVIVAAFKLSNT